MLNILHIIGSPRNDRSVSGQVAWAYIMELKKTNTKSQVDTLDVWKDQLPEFNEHALNAKYAGLQGLELSDEQTAAWNSIRQIAGRFYQADVIIFSVPMWNFGIPYKLKQLIDLISQKDVLFTFNEHCFNGMLNNKKAILISARGISYATGTDTPESEFDFQNAYMLMWFKFIGITDTTIIKVEQTLFGNEAAMNALTLGLSTASAAAAKTAASLNNPLSAIKHV
jgi:FMN-dependent NADH-azoreductase